MPDRLEASVEHPGKSRLLFLDGLADIHNACADVALDTAGGVLCIFVRSPATCLIFP